MTNNNAEAMYMSIQVNYWRGASLRATGMGRTPTMTRGQQVTARFPLRGFALESGDSPEVVIESLCSCAEEAAAH